MLALHDPHRPTERRKIHRLDLITVLDDRRRAALTTRWPLSRRCSTVIRNTDPVLLQAEELDIGQTDQDLERARTINNSRAPRERGWR